MQAGTILPSGDPRTVADGLRTSLGTRPFSVIQRHVDAIVTATEAEILDAMRFVWERFKIVVEPSGAVPVAPVLSGGLPVRGLRVGLILTGGNVDLGPLFEAARPLVASQCTNNLKQIGLDDAQLHLAATTASPR